MSYEKYKVNLEPGESGKWRLTRLTVTKEDEARERMRVWSNRGRFVPAGDYTALYRGQTIVMSDTPDEIRDHLWFIGQATGHVLINGLGLGMCALAAANKDEVLSVTVIEASEDVIKLVASQISHPKITVIHADAYEWTPPKGMIYDAVWNDIWGRPLHRQPRANEQVASQVWSSLKVAGQLGSRISSIAATI